jgi:heme/copper-type cytochrome/quinol oxidase subunit 2
MVVGLIAMAIAFVPLPRPVTASTERHFRIEAGRFQYLPAAMTVNSGDHVTIDLVATDVVHGLYIDGYDLNVVADPGQTASLSFVADQAGTFRLRCSIPCGALHPFMIGKLHVGRNELLWRGLTLAMLACVACVWVPQLGARRQ